MAAAVYIDKPQMTFCSAMHNLSSYATWASFTGPVEYSGSLYMVGCSANAPFNPIQAHKSTDGGKTWVWMDSGVSLPTTGQEQLSVQAVGSILYVCYYRWDLTVGATSLRVIGFDMSSDTWTSATVDMPLVPGEHVDGSWTFLVVAPGTFNIVFNAYGPPWVLEYQRYTAGAWLATPVVITDSDMASPPVLTGFARDLSTGTLHFLYSQYQLFGGGPLTPNVVKHRTISSAGALSAPDTAIADAIQPGVFESYPGFGQGVVSGNLIVFPWLLFSASFIGNPSTLAFDGALWSTHQISLAPEDAYTFTNSSQYTQAFLVGSTIHIFWCTHLVRLSDDINVNTIRHITTADGVTFSAIDTVMDFGASLPPAPPAFDLETFFMFNLSVAVLSDGRAAAMFASVPTDNNVYTFFFLAPGPAGEIVTLYAWVPDILDPTMPAFNLPVQFSSDPSSPPERRITGVMDGTNPTFTLMTSTLVTEIILLRNGDMLTADSDYTFAGNVITFIVGTPVSGDILTSAVFNE